jgi:hypothetical protein
MLVWIDNKVRDLNMSERRVHWSTLGMKTYRVCQSVGRWVHELRARPNV